MSNKIILIVYDGNPRIYFSRDPELRNWQAGAGSTSRESPSPRPQTGEGGSLIKDLEIVISKISSLEGILEIRDKIEGANPVQIPYKLNPNLKIWTQGCHYNHMSYVCCLPSLASSPRPRG